MSPKVVTRATAICALFALGGCSNVDGFLSSLQSTGLDVSGLFESGAAEQSTAAAVTSPTKAECLVLATALDTVARDWRTNPKARTLRINTYAVGTDRLDTGYLKQASGLLPPKSGPAIDVGGCGTVLASTSDNLDFVEPENGMPGDRKSCQANGGGWVSRAGIDADRTHAVVLYTNDACGGSYWLVRMTKNYRGIWISDAPDPLYRSSWNPDRTG